MTGAVLKNDQLLTDLAEDFQLLVMPLETPSQKQIGNFLVYAERGEARFKNPAVGVGVVLSDVIFLGLGWTKNWLLEGDAASVESYLKRPFPPDEVLPAQVPVQLPMYPAQVPALRVAAAKGHVEVVQLLLLASADTDKADQNEGRRFEDFFQLIFLFSR